MIQIKEEFVGSEKYRRAVKLAGDSAIVMWLALKCYASQHPLSEGFVPNEDIDDLLGAPRSPWKALKALVDCGRLLPDGRRSAGLVDPAEGGYQLHDYLDHSVTPEELELRRERARLKKQRQRQEQRRELAGLRAQGRDVSPPDRGDTGGTPGDMSQGTGLAGAGPPAPAPTRAGARPQPSPTLSNPLESDPDPESARADDGSYVQRVYEMPKGPPPQAYFDECLLAGVGREQAVSTWNWYVGAGLPKYGVQRLHHWLAHCAKERTNQLAKVDPGGRRHGSAQPNAGKTGWEHLAEGRR